MALPLSEVTNEWTAIDPLEVETENVAHLDAKGLRYYLTALMLWVLDHHDDDPSFMKRVTRSIERYWAQFLQADT